jgi:hypothetical protein
MTTTPTTSAPLPTKNFMDLFDDCASAVAFDPACVIVHASVNVFVC